MKKTLFSMLFVACALCASADTYFFVPGEAVGDADGTSWENAAGGADLGEFLASAEAGTVICLQEGKYVPSTTTNKWSIGPGVTLIGGYPATMTGTDTNYDLSQGGQSVFSADLDNDGKGDNSGYAFVYIGEGDSTEKQENYYKDWTLTTIKGITFRDGYRKTSKYWGNMVFIQHAKVDFHFCQFINNNSWREAKADNGSNGALQIWGSQVRVFDCIFRDNITAAGSGAAFQVRARQSNSGENPAADKAIVLFDRCEFTNNIAYCTGSSTETNKNWGTYGGNCAAADNAGTVVICNSTISDAKAWYRGSSMRVSTNDTVYFINNTIQNNACVYDQGSTNGNLSAGDGSQCFFAGNIIVDPSSKDKYNSSLPVVCFQSSTAKSFSAGWNIMGTILDNGDCLKNWPATDVYPSSATTVNTCESVFGSNSLAANGGVSKTIVPQAGAVPTYTVADLQAAIAGWNLPACVKEVLDVTKDQRGYTRAATSMAGAYDVNAAAPSALENVNANVNVNQKMIINGQLVIKKNGVLYNAMGVQL